MQPPITLAQMTKKRLVSIGLPGPTMVVHQPGLPVIGIVGGDELIAGQGMTDQDGVALVGVERAIGHIGDGEGRQRAAAIQLQRRVDVTALPTSAPGAVTGRRNLGFTVSVIDPFNPWGSVAKARLPPCQ